GHHPRRRYGQGGRLGTGDREPYPEPRSGRCLFQLGFRGCGMRALFHIVGVVFFKELADILRDRRALLTVGLVSILSGPVLLLMLAGRLSWIEAHAARRIMLVEGMEHAPTLQNYLERETIRLELPPSGYIEDLKLGRLPDPVVVVPADFEQTLAAGGVP